MVWLQFVACVVIIAVSGRFVARYADVIAEKTGLGRLWIGVVLVAITTSLPEVVTGISAAALVKEPDLTIGDLFGANTFNLANLAVLDIMSRRGPLLALAGRGNMLPAGLSLVIVSFAAASILLSGKLSLGIGYVGIYTPMLILLYLAMARMIRSYGLRQQTESGSAMEEVMLYRDMSARRAYVGFAIAAVGIAVGGAWLAFVGKEIGNVTGLADSFVGSLFLAFTTTLPEITVSFSALQIGAIDIGVANMIGSNIFNMTIIGIVDLFYVPGPVLAHVSQSHVLTALTVILMTGILIAAMVSAPQRKTPLKASWYSIASIAVFLLGTYLNYSLSS